MSAPFSFTGKLSYVPDTGLQPVDIPFNFTGVFDSAEPGLVLQLTGSGTKVLDLGTVAMAKLLMVKVDAASGAAPVNFRFNGGGASGEIEVPPGGGHLLVAPAPVAGITAISIVYTTAVTVRIWVLG